MYPARRAKAAASKKMGVEARSDGVLFEPEIDHFVMAITAAEATVRHTTLL
jgi:hypothetical protein